MITNFINQNHLAVVMNYFSRQCQIPVQIKINWISILGSMENLHHATSWHHLHWFPEVISCTHDVIRDYVILSSDVIYRSRMRRRWTRWRTPFANDVWLRHRCVHCLRGINDSTALLPEKTGSQVDWWKLHGPFNRHYVHIMTSRKWDG